MDYNVTFRKKNKGWQCIISYKDNFGSWKQKSKQGFKTQKDSKPWVNRTVKEIKKSVNNNADPSMEGITFKEFSDMYIEHINLYKEPNTIVAYKAATKHFENLNAKSVAKITKTDIQACVDNMVGKGLNPNTIIIYTSKISSIFKSAIKDYGLLSKNPADVKMPKKTKSEKKALSKQEETNLLNNFKNDKYYLFVLITLKTGMRIGEICGLTWDCVDFKSNKIKINKQWKINQEGVYTFGELKSPNSHRVIPAPKCVIDELKKYSKIRNIDNRVFNINNTGSATSAINKKLNKYDITLHELRHTYATNLISNGVDFKTAAQILGHDVEQTLKTYSHVTDDMMENATNIIDKIF